MNIYTKDRVDGTPALRWLFLDMNAFFASCEQQANPGLRGKPIAIVPMEAESTCAIAASYEAKAFGIKTGTIIRDARILCPDLILVPARPKLYVTIHHAFVEAVEQCIPVEDVLSVDEVACRLDRTQQTPAASRLLAMKIKQTMREKVGEVLTCSIGIAENKLLAKLASDMQKPDGLTILHPDDLPGAILHLKPGDLSGIGPNMVARLASHGLTTMIDLWHADAAKLRRVWSGVMGARFHALLHGMDLPSPTRPRRSMGHQHVLPPEERTIAKATPVIRQLLTRVAVRLRDESFYCRRMILDIKWTGHLGYFVEDLRFKETQDTRFLMQILMTLWRKAPELRPLRIGVTLADLVPITKHQYDLFDRRQNEMLTRAVDTLNDKYGRGTIQYGCSGSIIRSKISFNRVPGMKEV